MLSPKQTCIVTIVMCALLAALGWCVTGHPRGYEPAYISAGVAVGAILSAVGLIGRRAVLVAAADEVTMEDRPRLHLPPGTLAMRRADMDKMIEGEISLDEFVDIWSGREIVEARESEMKLARLEGRIEALQEVSESLKHRVPKPERTDEEFKEDVRVAVFKEIMRDPQYEAAQPACRKCLGIHETQTCTAAERGPFVVTKYKPAEGDRVRIVRGCNRDCFGVLKFRKLENDTLNIWSVEIFGNAWRVGEECFVACRPKKNEVWRYMPECIRCDISDTPRDHFFTVDRDWDIVSPEVLRRINCGCFYRMGMDDKK